MTSQRSTNLNRQHGAFARVLSFVLLGFIVYGTTIEAAHKHAGSLNPSDRSTASSVTTPRSDETVGSGLVGCSDCLICQLHQTFSSTLPSSREITPPTQEGLLFSRVTTLIAPSRINAPRSGRAPPFTS